MVGENNQSFRENFLAFFNFSYWRFIKFPPTFSNKETSLFIKNYNKIISNFEKQIVANPETFSFTGVVALISQYIFFIYEGNLIIIKVKIIDK